MRLDEYRQQKESEPGGVGHLMRLDSAPHFPHHFREPRFNEQPQVGDEIWSYSSSQQMWDLCMGSAGFLLVRDGEIVEQDVCVMN